METTVMHVLNLRVATALASLAIVGNAAAQVSIGAGADFTTGKYGGSESTDTLYIPFIFKYETGPWVFKATVPYIRISGPANVIGAGAERITLPGTDAERRTETGLGDIATSAFYNLLNENQSGIGLDVGVKLKVPTADEEKRLGTGELDYALQADVIKPFGNFTAFGSLGYRF